MPTEAPRESGETGPPPDARHVAQLIDSYSPAVRVRMPRSWTEEGSRAEQLAERIRRVVAAVVAEEVAKIEAEENAMIEKEPADLLREGDTRTTEERVNDRVSKILDHPDTEERLHDRVWKNLVQPDFDYTTYLSTNHFQANLSRLQRRLVRSLAPVDAEDLHSAIIDILSESLRERGESRQPHPFRDFFCYESEKDWWNVFYTSARRRYIRNIKNQRKLKIQTGEGIQEIAENSAVERDSLERHLAASEIDNLPDTFTPTQREILRHVLQGHPLSDSRHYSDNYIRKIVRKATAYFRKRG